MQLITLKFTTVIENNFQHKQMNIYKYDDKFSYE